MEERIGMILFLAYSPQNNSVILCDNNYSRMKVYDANSGNLLFIFGSKGTAEGQFENPRGIAVSPRSGNIVVADCYNQRIQIFDGKGTFLSSFQPKRFHLPEHERGKGITRPDALVVDDEDRIVVAVNDYEEHVDDVYGASWSGGGNPRVEVYSMEGNYLSQLKQGHFSVITALAGTRSTNILVGYG